MKPQRPDNAPGYKFKGNRNGSWREGWEARHDLVRRGYGPSWVRLHYPDTPEGRRQLSARCRDLQGQMLAWAANEGKVPELGYDGTIKGLARRFQGDQEGSPYFGLKWNSQAHLDKSLKIVVATVGDRQISKLLGPDFSAGLSATASLAAMRIAYAPTRSSASYASRRRRQGRPSWSSSTSTRSGP